MNKNMREFVLDVLTALLLLFLAGLVAIWPW